MQSRASSGLNLVAPAPTELQLVTRTEAQPGQSEPNAQPGEEIDPQEKLQFLPHTTPQTPLQCFECHIIFSDSERQERHLKRSHPAEYEQYILRNAFFACYICGLQFTNSRELLAHQETHTERKPYKCFICGQAFKRAYQLTLHKKIHIGHGGYRCTDCGKACKTMTLLKYHQRTHTGERPFICKECGRRFAMSKYLKKHMLFHSKRGTIGDARPISDDGALKSANTLLNHVKPNHASLPAEAEETPPAGHQMKQSTPVITESISQPALPQLGANGYLLYVDTNMDTEEIHWHPESLETTQMVNHVVVSKQVPVGGHEVAIVDGGPKCISCSVCNTTFKTTTALLSHIKTRHASLLSAASKASAAGLQINLPITQDALLRLLASGPKDKYDANMDEEQIFRLTEFLKGIKRVNNEQQASQVTEATETTEQTVPCSVRREESLTTDVIKVIIEDEIKDEEEYIGNKPQTKLSADRELSLSTVINKSQGVSAGVQPQHRGGVQVQEECSVGLNEAGANQGRSICWNVEPAVNTFSPSKQGSLACTDCGLMFTNQEVFKTHLHQHALEEEEGEDDEEEEAEKREDKSHAARLDFTEMYAAEIRDQYTGGDENLSIMSRSLQSNRSGITQDRGVRQNHSCSVCGKLYKYLNSLLRHEQQHIKSDPANKSFQKVGKYECPDCGMAFIRKARLIGHMRTHWLSGPLNLESLNCDQCNKSFTSEKSWRNHIELHKRKPFWCPSCSKGFFDEQSLEKHLQGHHPSLYTCDICNKSFRLHSQLVHHQNTHTGARPFQCTVCGQAFANPKKLILHKKIHVQVSSRMPLGSQKSVAIAKKVEIKEEKQTFSVSEVKDTNISEPMDKECLTEESRTLKRQDAEFVDCEYTVEEDWEPVYPCTKSKPHGFTASHAHHESSLETSQPQRAQHLDEMDTIMYEDHKYWEWECCVCEMGFDEVAELHTHYIKHATGEVPIPHDGLQG
ncbi:uncharacterized protein LOC141801424 [Halichoeres trimaculatus]|uniref:uncharacterized protein LOC141801424 n=1 Tax=Halichoeres trimaculatus TaxID=147232 RepID=UPI003D9E6A04